MTGLCYDGIPEPNRKKKNVSALKMFIIRTCLVGKGKHRVLRVQTKETVKDTKTQKITGREGTGGSFIGHTRRPGPEAGVSVRTGKRQTLTLCAPFCIRHNKLVINELTNNSLKLFLLDFDKSRKPL